MYHYVLCCACLLGTLLIIAKLYIIMVKYAHTAKGKPRSEWHDLGLHLDAVSERAREFADVFGGEKWGEYAGKIHDAGKARKAFQEYLNQCAEGKGKRGSTPHSIYGARLAVEKHKVLGKLLAYVISGHHGGLPDWDSLERRLFEISGLDEIATLGEGADFPQCFPFKLGQGDKPGFALAFFTRMVFSCLVDADWLDTEAFMDRERSAWRAGSLTVADLAVRFFPKLEALCAKARPSSVNSIRREAFEACLAAAEEPPGLFSLTAPTGCGKTLSSLAFALRHAERHGLSRIVYVIPFTSIIEQNADVFREFLGDDAVVEHHSAVDPGDDAEEENLERRRARLACENWDAPLVATTAVQFFESLFAAKPSRCRKLHNLAGSVIILDEVQTLPQGLLLPCLAALRELAARYGASIVLCTATQPAIEKRDDFPLGLDGVREILSDRTGFHERLRRVRVEDLGTLGDEALCARLGAHDQALCIVNTRKHARALFEGLSGREGVYHLSACMTAAHRSERIAEITTALAEGKPCLVISTQLVEAGVNLDFPVVYREAAGLDAIAQAAGRCDREGRLTEAAGAPAGQVFIFTPEGGLPAGHFRITADKAAEVLRQGYADPLAPEAVERYFRLLFWQAGEKLDAKAILKGIEGGASQGMFCFREVAEAFRFIENNMRPVIVARDDAAQKLVRDLEFDPAPGRILRKLQRHMVQLHERDWNKLVNAGAARIVLDGLAVLDNLDLYNDDLGLCPEDPSYIAIDRLTQ